MNSMERVLATLNHKEPDRVPIFHLLSTYGAKELGIPIKEYFSKASHVVEAQLRMRKKYSNDCIYTFFHAPLENQAFGGEVLFKEDGPPNTGEPIIQSIDEIMSLEVPRINESIPLQRVLKATNLLKKSVGNEVPIIGVVMSPYALPVMQMGFEKYLELLYFRPKAFNQLMEINKDFCIQWANAQLKAGATAICYFNPLASPTIIERKKYLETGHKISKEIISQIKGPTATHLASGITLPVIDDIVATGSLVLGFSAKDDILTLKDKARKNICLLGNLNGIDMVNWDRKKARTEVTKLIKKAAPGGGFILSDNHGEMPIQVSEEILLEISETVKSVGKYPIKVE